MHNSPVSREGITVKCPPCTHTCDQGRRCTSSLTTGNGGNVITNGQPLPPRPKTFTTDFGIEHSKATLHITPLGWIVAMVCVIGFVIGAYARA